MQSRPMMQKQIVISQSAVLNFESKPFICTSSVAVPNAIVHCKNREMYDSLYAVVIIHTFRCIRVNGLGSFCK